MAKLWKRIHSPGQPAQLQEVDLTGVVLSSPTIIYLSGYRTTDTQKGFIAGAIKSLETLLQGAPSPPPQIYAWSHTSLRDVFNLAAYNLRPQTSYGSEAETLARSTIMPLVSHQGRKLPVEEAGQHLRNLTFVGYSAGTILAQEVFNVSMLMMQKLGYRAEEARSLLQEIVLVSAGSISRPTKETNRFTTIYMAAGNDRLIRCKNHLSHPLRSFVTKYPKGLTIKPLSQTSLLITTHFQKKMWEWRKTPDGKKTKIDIEPEFPTWTRISSNHELPHYLTRDDEHNQFSKIALYALVNATHRKSKPEVMQLLEPASAGDTPEEIAAYRERIKKAAPKYQAGLRLPHQAAAPGAQILGFKGQQPDFG